jgi:hypothetical protein
LYVWHQPFASSGLAFHPEDPNILFVCSAIGGELRALTLGASFESVVGEEVIAKAAILMQRFPEMAISTLVGSIPSGGSGWGPGRNPGGPCQLYWTTTVLK